MRITFPALGLSRSNTGKLNRFIKRRYARTGKKRLNRKRIFILPTYYGVVFALTIFVMLLGALNYNNNLAFMLTFLLMGVGLVATFHTYRNISQLSFRAAKTMPTFAGHLARFWVVADNRGGPARYAISLHAGGQQPVTIDIEANNSTTALLLLPTYKRGRIPYCVATVETRFPLGLYRAWSYVKVEASCLVYPRPVAENALPLPDHYEGGQHGVAPQGTDDFVGFRNYHPGDSMRHINWKAVARGQSLLTKQFSLPETNELWLDWDALPGTERETRLSQLCRWILDAHDAHLVYGLILPGLRLPLGTGEGHKRRCLEALALFELVE